MHSLFYFKSGKDFEYIESAKREFAYRCFEDNGERTITLNGESCLPDRQTFGVAPRIIEVKYADWKKLENNCTFPSKIEIEMPLDNRKIFIKISKARAGNAIPKTLFLPKIQYDSR